MYPSAIGSKTEIRILIRNLMRHNIFAICILALALASCQADKKDYTSFVKDAAGYHVISAGEVNLDNQFPVWADQLGNTPSDVDP